MAKAFLPAMVVVRCLQDESSSFCGTRETRPGYVRMYNKNAMTTDYVRAEPSPNRYGYLVNREDVPLRYQRLLIDEP